MGRQSIAIVGPTATGKTHRAVSIARHLCSEIISADSRQVYRGMDIGTGKDMAEYGEIPCHLIDVADAGDKYNLHRYLKDFHVAYDSILAKGMTPVICGGSGMYVENALKGIVMPDVPADPELREALKVKSLEELTEILAGYITLHNTTDVDTVQRAVRAIEIQEYYRLHPDMAEKADASKCRPLDCLVIGVDVPRDVRRNRISSRLKSRLDEGMVEEIKGLIDSGINPENLIYYGLEYKFVTLFVTNRISYQEMFKGLETAIHQFAKRQMTWFRGMEKRGIPIHWLPYDLSDDDFVARAMGLLGE